LQVFLLFITYISIISCLNRYFSTINHDMRVSLLARGLHRCWTVGHQLGLCRHVPWYWISAITSVPLCVCS